VADHARPAAELDRLAVDLEATLEAGVRAKRTNQIEALGSAPGRL
jgi:hypothetical protein